MTERAPFQLPKPTADQEKYLRSCEPTPHDPNVIVGGPKYATEAATHLRYLRRCRNEEEEIEYLSSVIDLAESRGAQRGIRDLASALGEKAPENTK